MELARIAFNRPESEMLFVQKPLQNSYDASMMPEDTSIGVILLTGERPSKRMVVAFCSGGDQRLEVIKARGRRMAISIEYFGSFASHSIHAKSGGLL